MTIELTSKELEELNKYLPWKKDEETTTDSEEVTNEATHDFHQEEYLAEAYCKGQLREDPFADYDDPANYDRY